MCFGRLYFWRDANSNAAVWDWDLREQHPGVSDDEWQKLFCEAFDRGETAFVAKRIDSRAARAIVANPKDRKRSRRGMLSI